MAQTENKYWSAIGLAAKARKIRAGTEAVCDGIREKAVYYVIMASDVSDNTRKEIINCCEYYHVAYQVFSDKETIGARIGREECAAVAITDSSFARMIDGGVE